MNEKDKPVSGFSVRPDQINFINSISRKQIKDDDEIGEDASAISMSEEAFNFPNAKSVFLFAFSLALKQDLIPSESLMNIDATNLNANIWKLGDIDDNGALAILVKDKYPGTQVHPHHIIQRLALVGLDEMKRRKEEGKFYFSEMLKY